MITVPPTGTVLRTLLNPGISKVPSMLLWSSYPTNRPSLKYDFPSLVKISTSETDAVAEGVVFLSVDLYNAWPSNLNGSPSSASTITISRLTKSVEDGLINLVSRSNTFASSP